MMRINVILVVIACAFWLTRGVLASDRVSLSGYFKNYFIAFDRPEIENLPQTQNRPLIGAGNNRLRIKVSSTINDWSSVTFAYDFSPRVQDKALFEEQVLNLGFDPPTYRAADLDSRLYPSEDDPAESFAIFQNLDRAYLTINSEYADVYLGRQAIAWGSARVINPTDVMVPYAFNELDVEDRIGVDGIRVRVPISLMQEIDAGCVFGDDFDLGNSAIFLRSRLSLRRTDVSLLVVDFRENLLLGVDLTRSIGGAGFWFEGAYVSVDALHCEEPTNRGDYFRGSVGLDYSLRDGTYLFAEYHFNQAGASDPEDYLSRSEETAYREGSVYLLGKNYVAPGVNYQITPLTVLTGQALVNLTDPSAFLMPQVEYNIAEDIYLSAGVYLGLGKRPEYLASYVYGPFLRLRSEFGGYPDFYFTSFRIYF